MDRELYQKFFEIEDRHWWFTARQKIVADVLAHSTSLAKGSKALDVGCGTGALLKMLSKDFDAFGTDTSQLAIDFCRERGIGRAYCCTLNDFPHPEMRFDLVTMLDVLEHIEDDHAVLRQALSYLKPNGVLLLTVPAYMFLWSQHDVVNHHKRRYVRAELNETLHSTGFNVEKISYFNTFLFPAAVIARALQSFSSSGNDTLLTIPAPGINTVLQSIFATERFLLRRLRLPYGLSILALARKL